VPVTGHRKTAPHTRRPGLYGVAFSRTPLARVRSSRAYCPQTTAQQSPVAVGFRDIFDKDSVLPGDQPLPVRWLRDQAILFLRSCLRACPFQCTAPRNSDPLPDGLRPFRRSCDKPLGSILRFMRKQWEKSEHEFCFNSCFCRPLCN